MSVVSVVCCAGRGLCFGPIPRPEESYRVYVCRCSISLTCKQVQQQRSAPTVSRWNEVRHKKKRKIGY